MATINITYVKPTPAVDNTPTQQICATFQPTNAACDNTVFDGTYYDTNVAGFGDAMSAEAFWNAQVAHPGLIAALRAAMRSEGGSYDWTDAPADEVLYIEEIGPALAEQGFAFTVGSGS